MVRRWTTWQEKEGEPSVLILSHLSTCFTTLNSAQRGSFIIIYASMKWRQRHRWLWIEGEEIFLNLPWLTSEWEKDRKHDRNAVVQDWHLVWNVKVCYGTERGMERAVVKFRISDGWERTIKLTRGTKLICIPALTSCECICFHVLSL